MRSIDDKIIEYIRKNKVSTTEVADCLGKTGNLPGIGALNSRHFAIGPVFFAYAYDGSNWSLHRQLEKVRKGDIVFVETYNCDEKAVFGEIVSKQTIFYKEAAGIVVNGFLRDARWLIKEDYPIWCRGVTPIGCSNKQNEHKIPRAVLDGWNQQYSGTIAVCDDGGVVVIPKPAINRDFMGKLEFIELQEDIWKYCIDTLKWSTYRTVCQKEYLKHPEVLSEEHRRRLKKSGCL